MNWVATVLITSLSTWIFYGDAIEDETLEVEHKLEQAVAPLQQAVTHGFEKGLARIPFTARAKSLDDVLEAAAIPDPQVQRATPEQLQRLSNFQLVAYFARMYDVPEELAMAICKQESFGCQHVRGGRLVRSGSNAQGMMQIIPSTFNRHKRQHGLITVREDNAETGVRYLRALLNLWGEDYVRVIASYNAGENAVKKYGGVPPFRETQGYVRNVTRFMRGFKVQRLAQAQAQPTVAGQPAIQQP